MKISVILGASLVVHNIFGLLYILNDKPYMLIDQICYGLLGLVIGTCLEWSSKPHNDY